MRKIHLPEENIFIGGDYIHRKRLPYSPEEITFTGRDYHIHRRRKYSPEKNKLTGEEFIHWRRTNLQIASWRKIINETL